MSHPGDSTEQRTAEALLVSGLAVQLGVPLVQGKTLALPEGALVILDGFSEDPTVLVEAWAHLGRPKSAQVNKVMTDAAKLILAARMFTEPRLIVAVADTEAVFPFRDSGRSWKAEFMRRHHIELVVVSLPQATLELIRAAQIRQFR